MKGGNKGREVLSGYSLFDRFNGYLSLVSSSHSFYNCQEIDFKAGWEGKSDKLKGVEQ